MSNDLNKLFKYTMHQKVWAKLNVEEYHEEVCNVCDGKETIEIVGKQGKHVCYHCRGLGKIKWGNTIEKWIVCEITGVIYEEYHGNETRIEYKLLGDNGYDWVCEKDIRESKPYERKLKKKG